LARLGRNKVLVAFFLKPDAHRGEGKRLIMRADEKLTVFVELESAIGAQGKLS
jgi:hypothetical protein